MSFPTAMQNAIEEGRFAVRGLVRFDLGEGTYGFWNGTGDLVYSGLTYRPNSLLRFDDLALQLGTAAAPLTIEMPESLDFGITPDTLAEIETLTYKGARVIISDAYFNPGSRDLLHVEPLYEGYIDFIDHVVEGGEMKLVAHVETTALDNHRDGYRSASHSDQQLVSAGDMFFEHAAKVPFEEFKITLE